MIIDSADVVAGFFAEVVVGSLVLSIHSSIRISVIAILLTSCGMPVSDRSVKDFVISCMECDVALHDGFRNLVHNYNNQAGIEALHYTSSSEEANSPLYLTKGLNIRDGKVGWGQWIAETEERRTFLPDPRSIRTTSYSMRLELDDEFVRTKISSLTESDQTDMKKLFYHEVGHGLQMGHDPDISSVMYYDISGTKDFESYFVRVREFFAD